MRVRYRIQSGREQLPRKNACKNVKTRREMTKSNCFDAEHGLIEEENTGVDLLSALLAKFLRFLARAHLLFYLLIRLNPRSFRHMHFAHRRLRTLSKPEERKHATVHRL